jgi:hypothetical protein
MIKEIEQMEMPDWLKNNDFNFDVYKVLKDSLYYPCSRFDGKPVKYFMGNVFSFVYVDYGVTKEKLLQALKQRGFKGYYHIIHQQKISEKELIPNGWCVRILPDDNEKEIFDIMRNMFKINMEKAFCEWIIFERDPDKDDSHNPSKFSLLYLYADGVAAYQALYLSNKIAPKMIAIIQPGYGFGGNYTDFRDRKRIFAKSIFYDTNLLPKYIINGNWGRLEPEDRKPFWKEYNKLLWEMSQKDRYLTLWGRNV